MFTSNADDINKRQYGRVNKYFTAWFCPESTKNTEMVVLKNISAKGAYFWSSQKIEAGSYGTLTINFKPDKSPIKCRVKVIRCGTKDSRTIFPVAVEFVNIDIAHQDRIAGLVRIYNEKVKMIIENGALKFLQDFDV